MKKRILSFLFVLLVLYGAAITASATHPVPNLTQNGSITLLMKLGDTQLDGGKMKLCKVGKIEENNGDYSFKLIDELQGSNVDLTQCADPAVSENLLKLAKDHQLDEITKSIIKGRAEFPDLPVGLYLVWQDQEDATEGFSPIQPFLISIPKFENNQYVPDVVANPKVPLETIPPETTEPPPTVPPDDELPYTGQTNWPVPVMASVGIVLFIVGWVLCAGRKRIEDEK